MKVQIFENITTLNEYLKDKRFDNSGIIGDIIDIKFQSEVVGTKEKDKSFIVVDRFMIIER